MTVYEEAGIRFVEGPEGLPLMRTDRNAGLVMDACFSHETTLALLWDLLHAVEQLEIHQAADQAVDGG